jgi:hypothetical protein
VINTDGSRQHRITPSGSSCRAKHRRLVAEGERHHLLAKGHGRRTRFDLDHPRRRKPPTPAEGERAGVRRQHRLPRHAGRPMAGNSSSPQTRRLQATSTSPTRTEQDSCRSHTTAEATTPVGVPTHSVSADQDLVLAASRRRPLVGRSCHDHACALLLRFPRAGALGVPWGRQRAVLRYGSNDPCLLVHKPRPAAWFRFHSECVPNPSRKIQLPGPGSSRHPRTRG